MVVKKSSVLKAFSLIGPEEILKLSSVLGVAQVVKKVAGDSFVQWDDASEQIKTEKPAAKVLKFPKPAPPAQLHQQQAQAIAEQPHQEEKEQKEEGEESDSTLLTAEMSLLHRKVSRDAEESLQKMSARNCYKKTGEVLMVKTRRLDGKEKIHFASTQGVLVDKKSA